MPPPDLTPAALPSQSKRPDDRRLTQTSSDAVSPTTILGRRDAVSTPWLLVSIVAFAIALSEGLHAPGGDGMWLTIGVASAYAVGGIAMALVRARADAQTRAATPASYAAFCFVLISLICAGSALSDGIQTVYFSSLVLIAAYLGLVVPVGWAIGLTLLMIVGGGLAHGVSPVADALDVLSGLALVVAGLLLGIFLGAAHRRAERIAMRLSRCDALTTMLNRRGFMEQLEVEARTARSARQSIALLILDLDGFKGVNTGGGTERGDELLAWIGALLREQLPESAAAGRLGGDEFGVALPATSREDAQAFASRLRHLIAARNPVSIGIATSQDSAVSADDLLKVGEAAMVLAKHDPALKIHLLVAGAAGTVPTAAAARPVITYGALRAMGGRPHQPEANILFGWLLRDSFLVLGLAGLGVVLMTIFGDGTTVWDDLIRYLGIPWVLVNIGYAAYFSGRPIAEGNAERFAYYGSNVLVGIGVGAAALAAGGVMAPILAGYYLKVLFDSAIGDPSQARGTFAVFLVLWVVVLIFSPMGQLWAVPFQLSMLVAAYILGTINSRAVEASTAQWLTLARTDVLTGLLNRAGLNRKAAWLLSDARQNSGRVGVVLLNLDGFKRFNDQHGLAAGDALLQRVAEQMHAVFPPEAVLARIGGDEFVAAFPVGNPEEAEAAAAEIETAMRPTVVASTASAVFPDDGDGLDPVVHAADMRSRDVKVLRSLQALSGQ